MLKRLQAKKSNYDVSKWEKERKDLEKIMSLRSNFPHKLGLENSRVSSVDHLDRYNSTTLRNNRSKASTSFYNLPQSETRFIEDYQIKDLSQKDVYSGQSSLISQRGRNNTVMKNSLNQLSNHTESSPVHIEKKKPSSPMNAEERKNWKTQKKIDKMFKETAYQKNSRQTYTVQSFHQTHNNLK